MDLTPSLPRATWLDRFAMRLGALLPDLDPETAWRYAEATFDDAADLEPDEAAEIFAADLPPASVGCPP